MIYMTSHRLENSLTYIISPDPHNKYFGRQSRVDESRLTDKYA